MALEARSTVSLVLKQIQVALTASIDPNLPIVYDQDLSVESAISSDRNDRNVQARTGKSGSILAYRRSVLRPANENIRLRGLSGVDVVTGPLSEGIVSSFCEFDFDFAYYTQDIRNMESFELTYGSQLVGSSVKQVSVDLGTLGLFTYQVKWEPLQELEIGKNDVFNQSLSGTAKVTGVFFVVTPAVSGLINTIDTTLKEMNGYDLEVIQNPRALSPM